MSREAVLQAVVEHLAADVLDLEHDVVAYRELAQSAMAHNADLVRLNEKLREQIAERREEIRRYTERAVSAC